MAFNFIIGETIHFHKLPYLFRGGHCKENPTDVNKHTNSTLQSIDLHQKESKKEIQLLIATPALISLPFSQSLDMYAR